MKTDSISAALRRLDLSDFEQVIYLSLLREGRATARLLSDRTGMTRPSVYDQLKKLIALNLVVELNIDGKAHFAAGDIKHLEALLLDRIDRLEQSRQFLLESLPDIEAGLDTVVPKIRFFEGEDGMKQLMKDVMWHDNVTLETIWNEIEMSKIYDDAFLRWWHERRSLRKISMTWCIPASSSKKTPTFFNETLDTVQKIKQSSFPSMSRLIYGNKVACVSAQKEAFGFIVESRGFRELSSLEI